jgi:hypothetical protein
MARRPRVDFPGAWHHVMNRGSASQAHDLREQFFLALLGHTVRRGGLEVHASCLMGTHMLRGVDLPRRPVAKGPPNPAATALPGMARKGHTIDEPGKAAVSRLQEGFPGPRAHAGCVVVQVVEQGPPLALRLRDAARVGLLASGKGQAQPTHLALGEVNVRAHGLMILGAHDEAVEAGTQPSDRAQPGPRLRLRLPAPHPPVHVERRRTARLLGIHLEQDRACREDDVIGAGTR